MNLFGASYQEFVLQLKFYLSQILPIMGATLAILFVFWLGRFTGKYTEQKEIMKNMPPIVRDEIETRDRRIADLELGLSSMNERYNRLVTVARATRTLLHQTDQALLSGLEKQARPLIEGKIA
ncbi:MAG: hypothetical protein ACXABY_32215 [Candidatus Thorarchaeota archaeon]|jgi:hypothetical protein